MDFERATDSYTENNHLKHLRQLQLHFRGQLRAQLKPLAIALGISDHTIRNSENELNINNRVIRPSFVNNRLTYCLVDVAAALAAAEDDLEVPKVRPAPPSRRGQLEIAP
jgi:hypothetical protein